jgi:ankyrin repeat protein
MIFYLFLYSCLISIVTSERIIAMQDQPKISAASIENEGSKLTHQGSPAYYKNEIRPENMPCSYLTCKDVKAIVLDIENDYRNIKNNNDIKKFMTNNNVIKFITESDIKEFCGKTDAEIMAIAQQGNKSSKNHINNTAGTDLYVAIIENDTKLFNSAIAKAGTESLNFRNYPRNETLAHVALNRNRPRMFKQIMEKATKLGVRVDEKGVAVPFIDARGHNQATLAHYAVALQKKDVLVALKKHHANFEIKNRDGMTPLALACKYETATIEEQQSRAEIVTLLGGVCVPKKFVSVITPRAVNSSSQAAQGFNNHSSAIAIENRKDDLLSSSTSASTNTDLGEFVIVDFESFYATKSVEHQFGKTSSLPVAPLKMNSRAEKGCTTS